MTQAKDLIHSFNHTPDTEGNFNGLTKREFFAINDNTPLPDLFCLSYLREKEKENGGYKKTDGSYYDLLSVDEKAEVRALWKVKCADALIAALNK